MFNMDNVDDWLDNLQVWSEDVQRTYGSDRVQRQQITPYH